tara:strand:+ start:2396 stop:3760 length:1365 start_codon:yes stop_codon:yes gene_type:complete
VLLTPKPFSAVALAMSLIWLPAGAMADSNEPAQAIPELRESIEALQGSGDTWHPDIAESTLSLARHVQETGDHVEAIALLERAVHVSRVNHGLFSLQQVDALEMQIQSHLALEQWSEADGLQQYLFYVHSRAMADNDPALIPALEAYAQWNIQAFRRRLGEVPAIRLIDAFHLYSVALSIVDADPVLTEQSREMMLERLAYLAWLMARTGAQDRQQAQYTNFRMVDDEWVNQVTERRYRRYNNPFLQGEYALEQIVAMRASRLAAVESAGVTGEARDRLLVAHTNAILDLADWYLLFERRNAALDVYESAWATLQDEDEALQRRVFDRIVMLPRFETVRQPTGDPVPTREMQATAGSISGSSVVPDSTAQVVADDSPTVPYVVMEFDINQYGRAVNVDILESWPEDDVGMHRRLIGALRDSRMRPIFRDGSASRVRDLVYRFPYEIERDESETQ